MQYRSLGKTGWKISETGFGCMSLSRNSEKENIFLLNHARDKGINFFDTADLYDKGLNETIVGKAIKDQRQNIILATKAGNQWRADGSGWDWNPQKKYILEAADKSLQRLGTDYIDLYQLHGGTIDDPIDDTIEAFEILKQQGKILHYGISSIRPNVIREYIKRSAIVSVMMQYSVLDRRPEETILVLLLENNISVLARGALAQGLLINKQPKEYLGLSTEQVRTAAGKVDNLSDSNRTVAQTALAYVLDNPVVASAVIGIRTREQLEEVTANYPPLKKADTDILKAESAALVYEQHR